MNDNLYDLIVMAKGNNQDALLKIINKFNLLIKKLSRKMVYDDAETDLIIFFIKMIKNSDLNKLKNFSEGALVKYIQVSLNHKAIDHCRKYYLTKHNEIALDTDIIKQSFDNNNNIDNKLLVDQLLNLNFLTKHQVLILKYYYLLEYSDIQIGNKLKISRQAVHKSRIKALNIIQKFSY